MSSQRPSRSSSRLAGGYSRRSGRKLRKPRMRAAGRIASAKRMASRRERQSRQDVPVNAPLVAGGLDHLIESMPHPSEYPLMAELSLARFDRVQIALKPQ